MIRVMSKSSSHRSRRAASVVPLVFIQGCRGYGDNPFSGGSGDAEAFLFLVGLALLVAGLVASARS